MGNKAIFESVKNLKLPLGKFALFGSGPLGVRGIRESDDADIIVTADLFNKLKNDPGWKADINKNGNEVLLRENMEVFRNWSPGDWNIDDLIKDAEIIEGLLFVKLEHVLRWKKIYGREKDLKDLELIESYLQKSRIL